MNKADSKSKIPVIGFAAYSGTGKTTLLKKIIPLLKAKGLRLAVLKHAHHDFEIDYPGKDSYELRKAGADEMLVVSDKRLAKVIELTEPLDFHQCLQQINHNTVDLILVEGFKRQVINKIELHREASQNGRAFLHQADSHIVAIATDNQDTIISQGSTAIDILDINNMDTLVTYIENNLQRFVIEL